MYICHLSLCGHPCSYSISMPSITVYCIIYATNKYPVTMWPCWYTQWYSEAHEFAMSPITMDAAHKCKAAMFLHS